MKAKSKRRKVVFSPRPKRDLHVLVRRRSQKTYAKTLANAVEESNMSDEEAAEAMVEEGSIVSDAAEAKRGAPAVPALFTSPPPIRDELITTSSEDQDETVQQCLPYLAGIADPRTTFLDFSADGVARLEREDHVRFLTGALQHARYIAYDAQRPWCVYWALTGLSLLGEDLEEYRQR